VSLPLIFSFLKMKLVKRAADLRALVSNAKRKNLKVGFVPTMGYLHGGHLSLVKRAKEENDFVVVSIFVNPTQFAPGEDYERYPRDLERDLKLLKKEGVDAVFAPPASELYPEGFSTFVEETRLSKRWEGEHRPGHFRGVCTVVLKLFNLVSPDRAYFGEKDYQQLRVVQKMVEDLNLSVEVVGCPTVREEDGLAMSSRNSYLSPEERKQATALYRSFLLVEKLLKEGETDAQKLTQRAVEFLKTFPLIKKIDYYAVVDPQTLEPLKKVEKEARILAAIRMPSARLIDNWALTPPKSD